MLLCIRHRHYRSYKLWVEMELQYSEISLHLSVIILWIMFCRSYVVNVVQFLSVDYSAVTWLQCSFNECHGVCCNALSAGVHVSCNSSPAHLHEQCWTGKVLLTFISLTMAIVPPGVYSFMANKPKALPSLIAHISFMANKLLSLTSLIAQLFCVFLQKTLYAKWRTLELV